MWNTSLQPPALFSAEYLHYLSGSYIQSQKKYLFFHCNTFSYKRVTCLVVNTYCRLSRLMGTLMAVYLIFHCNNFLQEGSEGGVCDHLLYIGQIDTLMAVFFIFHCITLFSRRGVCEVVTTYCRLATLMCVHSAQSRSPRCCVRPGATCASLWHGPSTNRRDSRHRKPRSSQRCRSMSACRRSVPCWINRIRSVEGCHRIICLPFTTYCYKG